MRKYASRATNPATMAPVTRSQNLGTWLQIGSQPAWLFPFFPTIPIAKHADTLDTSSIMITKSRRRMKWPHELLDGKNSIMRVQPAATAFINTKYLQRERDSMLCYAYITLFYLLSIKKVWNRLHRGGVGVFGLELHVEDLGRILASHHHGCSCNGGSQGQEPQDEDRDVLGQGHSFPFRSIVVAKYWNDVIRLLMILREGEGERELGEKREMSQEKADEWGGYIM